MKYRFWFLVISLFLGPYLAKAQDCSFTVTFQLLDERTGEPLAQAHVQVEELKRVGYADAAGTLTMEQWCKGSYHVTASHIGCAPERSFFSVFSDTTLYILLHHHAELLNEIVVHTSHEDHTTQNSSTIQQEVIASNANKNLADVLTSISGVSTLRNGSGISKPVIHGLYGNRIAIMNNGILQSGQQWGNDHAPEIDPFVAGHLSVIKGAAALAYPGNALGGVVLVEPSTIEADPHLHGRLNYIFQTNGRGHTLNNQWHKKGKWASWRWTGTLKNLGDQRAPDYYLTNTGKREANTALQIDKNWSRNWSSQFYYSFFHTEIGILRGSHIGNLTDLAEAIGREEPFFTETKFDRTIDAPKQNVQHHLLKLEAKKILDDYRSFTLRYGGQWNARKEFDVRRGVRSSKPSLSMQQFNHFGEGYFQQLFGGDWQWKTGLQAWLVDNTNVPETGVSPLVPDYRNYHAAAYSTVKKEGHHWLWELGMRYDGKHYDVRRITQDLPRRVEQKLHTYHNWSASSGLRYQWQPQHKLLLNLGHVVRAPEVNELYSFGLHQGVSGIEEGKEDLVQERATKVTLSWEYGKNKTWFVQVLGYYQRIEDYIYLAPQSEYRLTIRGAFPLFLYEQTDADIRGLDFLFLYEPIAAIKWVAKASFLQGDDLSNDQPLVFMPSNNASLNSTFRLPQISKFKDAEFSVQQQYVFRQGHLLPEQDFLAPPPGYWIWQCALTTTLPFQKSSMDLGITVDNLFNTSYRDYLNRQRYFADELGRNVQLRLAVVF